MSNTPVFFRTRTLGQRAVSRLQPSACSLIAAVLLCGFGASLMNAQSRYVRPRIDQAIDDARRVTLRGNTHPLARREFERGAAPADLAMDRMLLVLTRSDEQQAELSKLIDDQHDASSPSYGAWLTPEDFGRRFGPSDVDLQAVTSWLRSHGFQVDQVHEGRTLIEFSGSARQVEQAFHTSMRKYVIDGEEHLANSSDPQIPSALAPVVAGISSLHDFHSKPQSQAGKEVLTATHTPGAQPLLNIGGGHALTPADYAVIYNLNPLYNSSNIKGQGTTIAVVGRSMINVQDVADFRKVFGLPVNAPQVIVNGNSPGNLGGGEEMEAVLDVTWAGATAPNAAIKFVVSKTTKTTDGVDLSEAYIINRNLADVMTESFGACETFLAARAAGIKVLAEQAAAQGITYIVSSGDSGSAGCDSSGATKAIYANSVNVLASTPYTIAVGGTQFNVGNTPNKYWSATNGPNAVSALSFIPENVWNESASGGLWASGGGVSSQFAMPVWQKGVKGTVGTFRNVPDVALSAAGGLNYAPYVLCIHGGCSTSTLNLVPIGGTSAAAPAFAGMMALVKQKANARLGQANYILYRLAAIQQANGWACNGSGTAAPASNCIFYDTTTGSNTVPGVTGYSAAGGYDLSTGLGSVNATNLVNQWSQGTAAFRPTKITLGINPTLITVSSPSTLNVKVTPATGSGTPTGEVYLTTDAGWSLGAQNFVLTGGLINSPVWLAWSLTDYNVIAHYMGDGVFGPSDSSPVRVVSALQVCCIVL